MRCPPGGEPGRRTPEALSLFLRILRPRPVADPYPLYARLREIAPALSVDVPGAGPVCLVSTYAHCARVIREARFTPVTEQHRDTRQVGWRNHPFTRCFYQSMLFRTGAAHRVRRTVVARHFTPRRAARRRREITGIVDRLLDELARRGADGGVLDLEENLALPFASQVIGRLLGIPDGEALRLGRYARATGTVLELAATPAQRRRMTEAGDELRRGLAAIAMQRRHHPGDDLLSDLAAQHAADEEELTRAALLLFGAGFDSPASLIGLGTRLFLDHPEQAAAVRADPGLGGSAVEEILRYEPPIQVITRVATEQVRLADVTVEPGGIVLGLVPGANRDPAYVPDPDRFDVRRVPSPGLGFGTGAHYCLGAAVARLQAELLFPRLLSRFPRMEPGGAPRLRSPGSALRGFEFLPVRLSPRGRG